MMTEQQKDKWERLKDRKLWPEQDISKFKILNMGVFSDEVIQDVNMLLTSEIQSH